MCRIKAIQFRTALSTSEVRVGQSQPSLIRKSISRKPSVCLVSLLLIVNLVTGCVGSGITVRCRVIPKATSLQF
jgi:hypothetical protein